MREIKFRGLRSDGQGWVYGYYSPVNVPILGTLGHCINENGYRAIDIDYKSLGQSTGKKDSKGKEIYEGDLIEFDAKEWGCDKTNIHSVEWDDINAEWSFGGGCVSDMHFRTVIGNIHEKKPQTESERIKEVWDSGKEYDKVKLPKGQIDEMQPFESWSIEEQKKYEGIHGMAKLVDAIDTAYLKHLSDPSKTDMNGLNNHIKFAPITPESYDSRKNPLLPTKGYVTGTDLHDPTSTDATAVMITCKKGDKLVAEYFGIPKEGVAFPELLNELLQYYPPDSIVKERTDEDVMMELKAIQMFRPNVLKEFIEQHYGIQQK